MALERAGIPIERYVAYEIDNNAIKISQKNYPDIEQYKDDGFKIVDFKNGKVVIKGTKEENNDYFVNSITGFTNIDLVTAKWETKDKKKLPKNSLYRRTIALRDEYDKYITTMAKMRGTDVNSFINSLIKKEN